MKDRPGIHCQNPPLREQESKPLFVHSAASQQFSPGSGWGPGRKNHYQIHHVLRGKGVYLTGEQRYDLGQGDTFLVCPHTSVAFYADELDPWECAWVGFSGTEARDLVDRTVLSGQAPVLRGQGEELGQLMEELRRFGGAAHWEQLERTAVLCRILAYLSRLACRDSDARDGEGCARLVAEYIVNHYDEPITVEALAQYAAVSHSSLYRRFVKSYGVSPKRFLLEYRIQRACEMLETTDCSVQEVSSSVGFEDPFYFSRAFKDLKGVSPRQYANAAKNKT